MTLQIGRFCIDWLDGGVMNLDGGAMFGVVPKPLWSKRYPSDDHNRIPLEASPILIRSDDRKLRLLVDTGLGTRYTEKQVRNFHITRSCNITSSLERFGLSAYDINYVILTHLDFDHASGAVIQADQELAPRYPNAVHWVNRHEWADFNCPSRRSAHTYWQENGQPIARADLIRLTDGRYRISDGIELIHTGGHTRGHQIALLHSNGVYALHLGDLLPTHAHLNPLWVAAYDNYPLESIVQKEHWLDFARRHHAWLLFYHDAMYAAIRLDSAGEISATIERKVSSVPQNS